MKKLFTVALLALFVASTSGLVLAQGNTTAAPAKTAVKTTKKKKSHVKKITAAPAAPAPASK